MYIEFGFFLFVNKWSCSNPRATEKKKYAKKRSRQLGNFEIYEYEMAPGSFWPFFQSRLVALCNTYSAINLVGILVLFAESIFEEEKREKINCRCDTENCRLILNLKSVGEKKVI